MASQNSASPAPDTTTTTKRTKKPKITFMLHDPSTFASLGK